MRHSRRPAATLRVEALESRLAPARMEMLSQSISGSIQVSSNVQGSTWSRSNTLTGPATFSEVEHFYSPYTPTAWAYHQAITGFGGSGLSFVSRADGHGIGQGNVDYQVTFRLNAEPHEEAGTPQVLVLKGGMFRSGATYDGLVSLVGPGVNYQQTSDFSEERKPLIAQIGATYTFTVNVSGTADADNPYFASGSELHVDVVPGVVVAAQYDDAGDPDDGVFGHYLSGVKLLNVFTVDSLDPDVQSFRLTVEGVPGASFTQSRKSGGTPFLFDMGLLPAGAGGGNVDYIVRVEALGSGNTLRYKAFGELKVIGQVGLDLLVQAAEDNRAPQPVEKARLIAGASKGLSLDFHPTLVGVPDFYAGRLALSFYKIGANNPAGQVPIDAIAGGQGTMATPVPGSKFADVIADPGFSDYDIVVTAANKFRSGKTLVKLSEPEHLRVIKQPTWLKKNATGKGAGKYVADADTATHYGGGAAAYKFVVDTGKAYNLPLPLTKDTPFDVFNKLKSGLSLDANFGVYAPLFEDQHPTVSADQFVVVGTVLGEEMFETELDDDMLVVSATLDPRTLAAPSSLRAASAAPANLLSLFGGDLSFTRTFGPWKVDVPIFTAGVAGLAGTVLIKGEFATAITQLDLNGDVTFYFGNNGKFARELTTGNLVLDVKAQATATLGAAASVNVKVLGYKVIDLASAQGVGTVTFDLTARMAGTFGGPKGMTLDKANSNSSLKLGYSFDYDISVLTEASDLPEIKHAEDSETGAIWDLLL